jgi:rod shape determining protein RodA
MISMMGRAIAEIFNKLKKFNWLMFAAMILLIAIGTIAIWSSGNARAEAIFHDKWISNVSTALFGLALYFFFAFTDYRKIFSFFAVPAYLVSVVFLIAVLIFGSTVLGGKRWLWFFQPSEVSKLCILALVAVLFGNPHSRVARFKHSFKGFSLAAVVLGVPCFLILEEPDLGTTLVLVPAVGVMLFVAGVWRRALAVVTALALALALGILGAVYEAEKPGASPERRERILKVLPLRPHQVKRVKVFLFPEDDPRGAGYNLIQAKITIGSGGMSGKGLGKGEMNALKYLPQAISMNDFIFCVWAEETGFLGSLLLISLFAMLLLPCCWIAFLSSDETGRLFSLGFATLVFAHMYINVAMSIGLVPITGLPLPFISSGRTFLVVLMCGFGMVQSVAVHRGGAEEGRIFSRRDTSSLA